MLNHIEFTNLLHYDVNTGIFTRNKSCKGYKSNTIVGNQRKDGYFVTTFKGKFFYLHRLAWFYVHKEFPNGLIDHINGNKGDNRIQNLRVVSFSENAENLKAHRDNKSGYKGVWFHKQNKRWRSSIRVAGKQTDLGCFDSAYEAHEAYIAASKKYQTCGIYKNV